MRDAELEKIRIWEEEKLRLAGDNEQAQLLIKQEADRQERELKRKQAQDNKAEAMFQIFIDTAAAVIATLKQTGFLGIPLSAIVGALGAAQLAAVAARPIPKFEKGTKNSPEGLAEVAERGREIIVDGKTGQARIAETRQYTYLSQGSVVVPNAQTEALLSGLPVDKNTIAYQAISKSPNKKSSNEFSLSQLKEAVIDGVKAMPQKEVYFDERGVTNFIKTRTAKVKLLNKRFRYNS